MLKPSLWVVDFVSASFFVFFMSGILGILDLHMQSRYSDAEHVLCYCVLSPFSRFNLGSFGASFCSALWISSILI